MGHKNKGKVKTINPHIDPMDQVIEGGLLRDVVDEDDGADVPVVVRDHALPETLLACGVPKLQS